MVPKAFFSYSLNLSTLECKDFTDMLEKAFSQKIHEIPPFRGPSPRGGLKFLGPYKSWGSYILETAWPISMILFATYFLHHSYIKTFQKIPHTTI